MDVDVLPNYTFTQLNETAYKILTEEGRNESRQIQLSYSNGYESLEVRSAYTLKADGQRINVDPNSILYGHGATSQPGYEDTRNVNVVFPDLEVGDQIVLVTLFRQLKPWFEGQFGFSAYFGDEVVNRDARVTLTAPAENFPMLVDATGVQGGERETAGGKRLWIWTFRNGTAVKPESHEIFQPNAMPHIAISTFASYADAAKIYAAHMQGSAAVTPEIQKLADDLTRHISGKRERAHVLYDWVATHISYVAIVLGAGGFEPNAASEVFATKYGDCKDHVMLLEAMLKAEGIESTPVLINAGSAVELPKAASPFNFNHMITYVPELGMFLDSTSRYAPFGTLPQGDQSKPVVLVKTGEVVTTPLSGTDSMHVVENIQLHENGTADGETVVTSTGDTAIAMRSLLANVPEGRDADMFRAMFGPGATGTIERGNTDKLTGDYSFKAQYTIPNYVNLPGPGALPVQLGFTPLSFASVIGSDLPERRTRPYACGSMTGDTDVTMNLPKNLEIVALPKPIDSNAGGIALRSSDEILSGNRFHQHTEINVTHASSVCDAAEYNASHDAFASMLVGLKAQVLYK